MHSPGGVLSQPTTMRLHVSSRLRFSISGPSRLFLNVRAQAGVNQVVERETLRSEPDAGSTVEPVPTGRENRMVVIDATTDLMVIYEATVDCAPDLRPAAEVGDWPAAPLDHGRIGYLFSSRYCESDQLGRLAWQKFGGLPTPFARASAVADWIHANITYVTGSTDVGTSAAAILVQRAGVCRDFAHLGVALCRALNLPARYVTGYACGLHPPDMHAWFEVAIGEHWVTFDATHLAPLCGLVRVAQGRDAADTAISTSFGPARALGFEFSCTPAVEGESDPVCGVPGDEPVWVSKP